MFVSSCFNLSIYFLYYLYENRILLNIPSPALNNFSFFSIFKLFRLFTRPPRKADKNEAPTRHCTACPKHLSPETRDTFSCHHTPAQSLIVCGACTQLALEFALCLFVFSTGTESAFHFRLTKHDMVQDTLGVLLHTRGGEGAHMSGFMGGRPAFRFLPKPLARFRGSGLRLLNQMREGRRRPQPSRARVGWLIRNLIS